MTDQRSPHDRPANAPTLDSLARQINFLRTVIGGLVAFIVVIFTAGVFWGTFSSNLIRYEAIVAGLGEKISKLDDSINTFKSNLAELGNSSYETEVSGEKAALCEVGNVVTGVRKGQDNRIWITCASMARAVWNPNASSPGAAK
jgi:hypothetical protein